MQYFYYVSYHADVNSGYFIVGATYISTNYELASPQNIFNLTSDLYVYIKDKHHVKTVDYVTILSWVKVTADWKDYYKLLTWDETNSKMN